MDNDNKQSLEQPKLIHLVVSELQPDEYMQPFKEIRRVELSAEEIELLKSSLKFGKQVAEDWAKDRGILITNKLPMEVLLKKLERLI